MRIETRFDIQDAVNIDGDTAIRAVVVGVNIYPTGHTYKLSWFTNGEARFEDFEEFRLSYAIDTSARPIR